MLQAKEVTIEYNETTGRWKVDYKGPSGVYQCTEYGMLQGATIQQVYLAAGRAVLAAANLVIPKPKDLTIRVLTDSDG
jgi:hypothetical protein